MSEIVVNAEARTSMKKHAKYSRWEGKIPGIYSGICCRYVIFYANS